MNFKVAGAYVALCIIWGSTWLAIRFGLENLTPVVSVGYRFTLASLFILAIISFKGIKIQTDKKSLILYLLMSVFSYAMPLGLIYWAEQFVPSGLAAVLYAVSPFFMAIFSFFLLKTEAIGKYKIAGMILGFSGIVLIFSNDLGGSYSDYLIGMAAIVLSSIVQTGFMVIIKKHGSHLNPLSMNFYPMLIAGLVMIALGYIFEDTSHINFTMEAVLSVIYLALFGSVVTFTTYFWLLKKINIIMLSLISFITPITALFLGWIFFNEQLTNLYITGCVLVLAGLLIANIDNFNKLTKLNSRNIDGKYNKD